MGNNTDGFVNIPITGGPYNATWTNLTNPGLGEGSYTGAGGYLSFSLNIGDTYSVSITGNFDGLYINNGTSRLELRSIEQWGTIAWRSMYNSFAGCANMVCTATDSPNLSLATSISYAFSGCTKFNGNIGNWNTTNITDMSSTFSQATSFNQDIGSWNTAKVQSMSFMFSGCPFFNQNISNWNTANVYSMMYMFFDATSFNQNISNWNTSRVGNMEAMFSNATSFNQNLGNWNMTNVSSLNGMLDYSGLSIANYDATLIGWANQNVQGTTASPKILEARSLRYCAGAAARATLGIKWRIQGDVLYCATCPNPSAVSISPISLSSSVVNASYNQQLTQTGLVGTPVWSVVGNLPVGFTLNSVTGIISGVSTVIGANSFTIQVTDGTCTQIKLCNINVICPTITFNASAPDIVVGINYNFNVGATGNTAPLPILQQFYLSDLLLTVQLGLFLLQ